MYLLLTGGEENYEEFTELPTCNINNIDFF